PNAECSCINQIQPKQRPLRQIRIHCFVLESPTPPNKRHSYPRICFKSVPRQVHGIRYRHWQPGAASFAELDAQARPTPKNQPANLSKCLPSRQFISRHPNALLEKATLASSRACYVLSIQRAQATNVSLPNDCSTRPRSIRRLPRCVGAPD